MTSKSMQMGDKVDSRLFVPLIKARFFVKTREAPAGTDLSGQVAIITGASSGLGLHCARHLLSLKLSHLILAVRSPEKGKAVAQKLSTNYPSAKIDIWTLEMSSYPSIQAFCQRAATELPRLDFTILNAGIFEPEFGTCPTGHERVVQVNYLSTFLLAILMLPVSKSKAPKGSPGRITIVSSGTALFARFPNRNKRPLLASFDDVKVQPWDPGERYFSSKMLGHLLFARMMDYINADDVTVNLVEPGMCKGSDLHHSLTGPMATFFGAYKSILGRRPEDGAWTYVDAAVVKGKDSHGCFLLDWEIHPFTELVYHPEGATIMDILWEETMAEFAFAGAREILEESKKRELA